MSLNFGKVYAVLKGSVFRQGDGLFRHDILHFGGYHVYCYGSNPLYLH